MDRKQINEFRLSLETELKRLEIQRDGILSTLDSLQRMEESLFGKGGPQNLTKEKVPSTQAKKDGKRPSIGKRVEDALLRCSGKFTRMELRDSAIDDGWGNINKNTFGYIFAGIVAKKMVIEIEPSVGNQPAKYCKPEEVDSLSGKPSPDHEFDFGFNLLDGGAGPKKTSK